MSVQYITGGADLDISTIMYKSIIAEAEKNIEKKYYIIVPEQFTLSTQKKVVEMTADGAILNIDILSFNRLAYKVFEELNESTKLVIEDTGKNMIIKRISDGLKPSLSYYAKAANRQGFTEDMKSLITELYQYNITGDDLSEMESKLSEGRKNPVLLKKIADAKLFLDAFNEYKKDKYITSEEILDLLIKVLPDSKMLDGSVMCFDRFTGFTPPELDLIRVLMHKTSLLMFGITLDGKFTESTGPHGLFAISIDTMQRLHRIAKEENIPEKYNPIESNKENNAIEFLSKNIFRHGRNKFHIEGNSPITINICNNPEYECAYVLSEITRLVHDEGMRYSDIAIVVGDMETYGEKLYNTLTGSNIPCFIDQSRNIMSDPFVEFIRASLNVLDDNFSRESVMRYLKSGFSDFTNDEIDRFDNYILAYGIRGKKKYSNSFITEKIKDKLSEDELTDLYDIDNIRETIIERFSDLSEEFAKKNKTGRSMTEALYSFVLKHDCATVLDELSKEMENSGELLLSAEYSQVYRLVLEIFEKMVTLLGDTVLTKDEYTKILESGFSEQEAGMLPQRIDQVMVGDLVRTRLPEVKVIFAMGFNDGFVPKVKESKGILTDRERVIIKEAGFELAPTIREKSNREQFYIYANLSKPTDRLYISYSSYDISGNEIKPSYFIPRIMAYYDSDIAFTRDEGSDVIASFRRDRGRNVLINALNSSDKDILASAPVKVITRLYSKSNSAMYENIIAGKKSHNAYSELEKNIAKSLYGELAGSVSRLELFSSCAFAHFLTYGLMLKERKEAKLSAPDLGTIFHNALYAFEKYVTRSGKSFSELAKDPETRNKFCDDAVNFAVSDENSILYFSDRLKHTIDRVRRLIYRTAETICYQCGQGLLKPEYFEQDFVRDGMKGRIDRIDTYISDIVPEGSGLVASGKNIEYARVIDYKSGNKDFNLSKVYYGLDLQLFTYLNHVEDELLKFPGHENNFIVPAGIFYYDISDPDINKGEGEEAVLKDLRLHGPAVRDPYIMYLSDMNLAAVDNSNIPPKYTYTTEKFASKVIRIDTTKSGELSKSAIGNSLSLSSYNLMEDYVDKKTKALRREIESGNIAVKPYFLKGENACTYCGYKALCGFDERVKGYGFRFLKNMTEDDVINKVKKEESK